MHSFVEDIHQLIRAEACHETVMETHIDEESIHYLVTLFATTTVATTRPIPTHCTTDSSESKLKLESFCFRGYHYSYLIVCS